MVDVAVEVVAELGRIIRRSRGFRRMAWTAAALLMVLVLWGVVVPLLRSGVAASGRITFRGKPIEAGFISFHVAEGGGNGPPVAGAAIQAGRYRVTADGGIVPGKYVVRIRAPQPPAGGGLNGTAPPATEAIPAEFNDRSRFIVETSRFRRNRFDFAIP